MGSTPNTPGDLSMLTFNNSKLLITGNYWRADWRHQRNVFRLRGLRSRRRQRLEFLNQSQNVIKRSQSYSGLLSILNCPIFIIIMNGNIIMIMIMIIDQHSYSYYCTHFCFLCMQTPMYAPFLCQTVCLHQLVSEKKNQLYFICSL